MAETFRQFFPPAPRFTEKDLPDLAGKIYLITGASSGIGRELTQLLYSHNATVYVAARSQPAADEAIANARSLHPSSTGRLVFLPLDLADLASVRAAARTFLERETRLQVLFHNAGVLTPPAGSVTKQGHELQLGVHCVGPVLLTRLLEGVLKETAASRDAERDGVRVVWVSSTVATTSPKGCIDMDNLDYLKKTDVTAMQKYAISKAGTFLLAGECARRLRESGVVSLSLDPGNTRSGLQRNLEQELGKVVYRLVLLVLHPAIKGAYSELYAGLSPEVTAEAFKDPAMWVMPWGRKARFPREDIIQAFTPQSSTDGVSLAEKFWQWCEEQVREYL